MSINLRWQTVSLPTCFHAAEALLHQRPLADAALSTRLSAPATALQTSLTNDEIPLDTFFNHLLPLSAEITSRLELAKLTLTKTVGRERGPALAPYYNGLLNDLNAAFQEELPRLKEQFPLHAEFMKEQWSWTGPALLNGIAEWSEPTMLAYEATVILLHPVCGGAGAAHVPYNVVRIEAVQANPVAELPEVMRLAWLLSLLNLDVPRFTECFADTTRAFRLGTLAMIPLVLAAAEGVKVVENTEGKLTLAVQTWLPGADAATASHLDQWWQVYRDTRPDWVTALAALDQMIA